MPSGGGQVRVDGLNNLVRSMRAAGHDLDDMKAAHARVAAVIAQWASVRAPRRTGRLGATVRGSGTARNATVRAGGAAARYAGPIHWGWPQRHIQAQPWMTDAASETEPSWSREYEHEVERILAHVRGV